MKSARLLAIRSARGKSARTAGHRREILAALWLMARGYRILGFRLKTGIAEIDLLAQKGDVLAVVEVKSRGAIEQALEAVGPDQRERLRRAGLMLAARRKGLMRLNVRLDLVALAPGRWPRHIPDAWRDSFST